MWILQHAFSDMNEEFQKTWQQLQDSLSLSQSASVLQTSLYLVLGGVLALYLRFLYRRCGASASDAESITRVFPLLTVITTADEPKSLPEPRRRGSLLPAYTKSNFLVGQRHFGI